MSSMSAVSPLYFGKVRREKNVSVQFTLYDYFFFCFVYYRIHGSNFQDIKDLPVNIEENDEDVYQELLEQYLDCFFPHDDAPIVRATPFHERPPRPNGTIDLNHSERFLLMICEFWLNHNSPSMNAYSVKFVIPSEELLYSVRRVVLHTLANPYFDQRDPVVNNLQLPLFSFLRACFNRWPLEKMTRFPELIVEIWLDFLQPWNAAHSYEKMRIGSKRRAPRPGSYTPQYLSYVLSNFPFYTVLLVDFLRVASNFKYRKSVYVKLVQGVLDVYSGTLLSVLRDTEHMIFDSSAHHSGHMHHLMHVRQQLQLLTGQGLHAYHSLESERVRLQAVELLNSVKDVQMTKKVETVEKSLSISQSVRDLFSGISGSGASKSKIKGRSNYKGGSDDSDDDGEATKAKSGKKKKESVAKQKLSALRNVVKNKITPTLRFQEGTKKNKAYTKLVKSIRSVFSLSDEFITRHPSHYSRRRWDLDDIELEPDRNDPRRTGDRLGLLTPSGKLQVKMGRRTCSNLDVPFLGDVWDRPATSSENEYLLRLMKYLSDRANSYLIGRCTADDCAEVAVGIIDENDEDGDAGPRCWEHGGDPEEIGVKSVNLRPFASYKNFAWLLILFVIAYHFLYSLWSL